MQAQKLDKKAKIITNLAIKNATKTHDTIPVSSFLTNLLEQIESGLKCHNLIDEETVLRNVKNQIDKRLDEGSWERTP